MSGCCGLEEQFVVSASAELAADTWAAVHPLDRWSVRTVISAQNLARRLRGSDFRVYVHPPPSIETLLGERGFRPAASDRTFVWEVAVFRRAAAAAGPADRRPVDPPAPEPGPSTRPPTP